MKIISLVAAMAVVLALATTASAQQASQDGYSNQAGQVQGSVNDVSAGAARAAEAFRSPGTT